MINRAFEWAFDHFVTIIITFFCVSISLIVLVAATSNMTEQEACEGYKYSKMSDVPAYCVKYFQE